MGVPEGHRLVAEPLSARGHPQVGLRSRDLDVVPCCEVGRKGRDPEEFEQRDALLGGTGFPGHADAVAHLRRVADRDDVASQLVAAEPLDPLPVVGESSRGHQHRVGGDLRLLPVGFDDDAGNAPGVLHQPGDRCFGKDRHTEALRPRDEGFDDGLTLALDHVVRARGSGMLIVASVKTVPRSRSQPIVEADSSMMALTSRGLARQWL